jgi:RNA polymerase sigma-70 factor, ECF subfamily
MVGGDVDDAFLVRRAQEGYLDAYDQLVDRHADRIYRLALRLLNNHHDAEDVTQESFIVAWESLPRYRSEASFATWLYRIATNRAINHARRRRTEPVENVTLEAAAGSADASPSSGEPADEAIGNARRDALKAAIERLPMEQRVILVLRQFEELSYAQIAEIRGLSIPAVKSHLLRARRDLARQLKDWR